MSTQQLQTALIELIRSPVSHRGHSVDGFVQNYDLTESEKWQLKALAADPFVSKFGKENIEKRYRAYILEHLKFTNKLMTFDLLKEFLYGDFESIHRDTANKEIFPAFIEYLEKNLSEVQEYKITPFIFDVMKYEFYDLMINITDIYKINTSSDSLLNQDCSIVIGEFKHDVLEIIENIDNLEDVKTYEKETTMLFVKKPTGKNEHITDQFEIDDSLKNFLNSQLKSVKVDTLPSFYQDLVEIGLCKK